MDQLSAHRRAQDVFAAVLARVTPDQLGAQSPCNEWDSRGVIDHVISGNHWVGSFAGSAAPDPVDDLSAAHATSAVVAQAVFAAPDGLSRMFELPFGTVPGTAFIGLRTSDVFTHAWDLAKASGQSTDLDPDLAALSLAAARERISPAFRGPGRPFGEVQPCPEDRPAADQLAAFLGRAID